MDNFMPSVNDQQLLGLVDDFIQTGGNRYSALERVVGLLASNYKHYNWTGIYILDNGVLKLGPYRGEPSPHVVIPVDTGICGAAVREGRTIVVPDVNADSRYLACSIKTKSEIVVPIFKAGKVVAEIDIDSDNPDAFKEADQRLLELVAEKLGELF
jgi:putative methionine-R-sulfoxide reductase with GAF domain